MKFPHGFKIACNFCRAVAAGKFLKKILEFGKKGGEEAILLPYYDPLLSAECQIGQQTLTNPYTPSVTAINKKSTNRQQNFGNIMIKR